MCLTMVSTCIHACIYLLTYSSLQKYSVSVMLCRRHCEWCRKIKRPSHEAVHCSGENCENEMSMMRVNIISKREHQVQTLSHKELMMTAELNLYSFIFFLSI